MYCGYWYVFVQYVVMYFILLYSRVRELEEELEETKRSSKVKNILLTPL